MLSPRRYRRFLPAFALLRYCAVSGVMAALASAFSIALSGCDSASSATVATAPIPAVSRRPVQDCGPRALLLAAPSLGVAHLPSLAQLSPIAGIGQDGASLAGMVKAAKAIGVTATGVQMDEAALANLSSPALAWVDGNHYVAVLKVTTDLAGVTSATIHDPNKQDAETMTIPELLRRSGGILLLLERRK